MFIKSRARAYLISYVGLFVINLLCYCMLEVADNQSGTENDKVYFAGLFHTVRIYVELCSIVFFVSIRILCFSLVLDSSER